MKTHINIDKGRNDEIPAFLEGSGFIFFNGIITQRCSCSRK